MTEEAEEIDPVDDDVESILGDALDRLKAQVKYARDWLDEARADALAAEMTLRAALQAERELSRLLHDELYPPMRGDEPEAFEHDEDAMLLLGGPAPYSTTLPAPVAVEPEVVIPTSEPIQSVSADPPKTQDTQDAKGRPWPKLTAVEIEERAHQTLAAIKLLWLTGEDFIARDVAKASGLSHDLTYRALRTLAERAEIRLVSTPMGDGDKRVRNLIKPPTEPEIAQKAEAKAPIVATAPKTKREDKSVMGALERLWANGDVTLEMLNGELTRYTPKVLQKDLETLERSGCLRLRRHFDGSLFIIPPKSREPAPGSIWGKDGRLSASHEIAAPTRADGKPKEPVGVLRLGEPGPGYNPAIAPPRRQTRHEPVVLEDGAEDRVVAVVPYVDPLCGPGNRRVVLAHLGVGCKWPVGEKAGQHLFCGEARAPECPYCERHEADAHHRSALVNRPTAAETGKGGHRPNAGAALPSSRPVSDRPSAR